jgi:hypothetical protein
VPSDYKDDGGWLCVREPGHPFDHVACMRVDTPGDALARPITPRHIEYTWPNAVKSKGIDPVLFMLEMTHLLGDE